MDDPQIVRPQPRRPFQPALDALVSPDSPQQQQQKDFAQQLEERLRRSRGSSINAGDESAPSRNRSFLDLTGSTLTGIYSDYGPSESATPWGNGSETPGTPSARGGFRIATPSLPSFPPRSLNLNALRGDRRPKTLSGKALDISLRSAGLLVIGVAYGIVVKYIQEFGSLHIAPVKMEEVDHGSLNVLLGWGVASVFIGILLPWLDLQWEETVSSKAVGKDKSSARRREDEATRDGALFTQIVRSIGIFVGFAFAIRKLPWQSTLQASVTLALVNPILWYIIDQTRLGFTLSSVFSLLCTSALLLTNPGVVPSPSAQDEPTVYVNGSTQVAANAELIPGVLSYEWVGVATWVSSILFCSCICFGNMGRLLAAGRQ